MLEQDLDGPLAAAREGRSCALEALCEAVRGPVVNHVSRHLGVRLRRWVDAEDVAQKVLWEVLGRLDRLPADADGSELMRRLIQTTNWRLTDEVRKHHRDSGESVLPAGAHEARAAAADSVGPVTCADRRAWLVRFVDGLPERYSAVVRLCALEGLSYQEAGMRLGIGAEAARKRYERARERLAHRMATLQGAA